TGPRPGVSQQPSPAERTGPRPGASHQPQPQGAQLPPPAERTGPRPGGSPLPPPAERTGPRPGASHQPPPAERTGPRPGASHQPQPQGAQLPPPAERTGPLPRVPMPPQGGQGPMPHQAGPPHSTTGQGPLPGYPARPKRGVLSGCLMAAVIVIVLLVLLVTAVSWFLRSPGVGADGPVQDGKLRFAVTSTKCPKPGSAATMRTCEVGVQVRNLGQEARVLDPGRQKLIDEDEALHDGAKLLDADGKEITPVRIEAGRTFKGSLVFELPKNLDPLGLEVHDSGLSRGARLNLD
ncbi:DUF4352 domain-containing protein, partial [Nonomuraea sp. NPDC004580]|uniref:DUF4352 domain-containing protein n=1 Tax=Nonomuraea sp. NPDC004580 TaxID=3154552 RepID=UPI0033BE3490